MKNRDSNLSKYICIAFHYVPGRILLPWNDLTLERYINNVNAYGKYIEPSTIKEIGFQLSKGLTFLHGLRLVHGDLKPANILMHEKRIKICDFGLTLFIGDFRWGIQTVNYRAPEVHGRCKYTETADIWSLGIILCEMESRQHPI